MVKFIIDHGTVKLESPKRKPKNAQEALEWSIAKWKFIVKNVEKIDNDGGPESCGLCMLYQNTHFVSCRDCPISNKVGCSGCSDTPYEEWMTVSDFLVDERALDNQEEIIENPGLIDQSRKTAMKELAFLESLKGGH